MPSVPSVGQLSVDEVCVIALSLSRVYTMQVGWRESSAGSARADLHASRMMEAASRFKVKHVELLITS